MFCSMEYDDEFEWRFGKNKKEAVVIVLICSYYTKNGFFGMRNTTKYIRYCTNLTLDLGHNPEPGELCTLNHDIRYQYKFMQNLERVQIIWGKFWIDFIVYYM